MIEQIDDDIEIDELLAQEKIFIDDEPDLHIEIRNKIAELLLLLKQVEHPKVKTLKRCLSYLSFVGV